ncbi:MAG TPA: hypothetical protein VFV46_03890 [Lacibacter sp.]|nr:hypothetical protein [Lacibacter sp.]
MQIKMLFTAFAILLFVSSCADTTEESSTIPVQSDKPATTQTPTNTTGNVALNPAHGQPGHRCDIAVGAPLNSAPAPATQTAPAQSPPMVMPAQPAPAAASAGGALNPAHGQPGHRCDIAVGAPLPK